jgi:hypothetical protein
MASAVVDVIAARARAGFLHDLTSRRRYLRRFRHEQSSADGPWRDPDHRRATNALDTGALLFATARIWSPQPGSTGSVSQSFPLIPMGALKPGPQAIILGQKIDSRYRTNVGIVNLDTVYTRTFDIVQSTDDPTFAAVQTTVTVAPMSMVQVRLQDSGARALQVVVTPRQVVQTLPGVPVVPDPTNQWVAYGSSVDNVTGDSWSNLAMPLLTP